MAGWKEWRRVRVRLARWRRAGLAAWDGHPRARIGAAALLALLVNAGLLAVFGRLPLRLPPEGAGGAAIEIVFLPEPPAPMPAPVPKVELAPEEAEPEEVVEAEPQAAPAPARPSAPEAELPRGTGRSGVVALDCNRVFDEEGRAIACAGGEITLGYEVDREAWDRIDAEVPRYGPVREADADAGFGRADDRFAAEPDRLGRLRRQGAAKAARRAAAEAYANPVSPIVSGGAEGAAASGADLLIPPSFITSFEERKRNADEAERRGDARVREEMEREARDR